jgi:hypothetical protein
VKVGNVNEASFVRNQPMQLATITLTTGTTLPGTEECQELLSHSQTNDFCKDMVVRSLQRVWLVADGRKELGSYRKLYTETLHLLGTVSPTWASY